MTNAPTLETLRPLIKLLTEAGEEELAQRLAAHSEAKALGLPLESMVKLWLE